MNTLRHPDFINLKQKIQSCSTLEKLQRLRQVVIRYGHTHADRAELMAYYLDKESELSPETAADELSMESERMKQIHNNHK